MGVIEHVDLVFIYLFMFVFFFFVLGLVYFFSHSIFFIAHTYRSSILIKIIKSGKALIFFLSDKPNFISPNFIVTPTRRVWSVSYNTQKSFPIYPCFFASFSFFFFFFSIFPTFLPLKVEEKQSLCHETAKLLIRRKPALD